MSPAPFASHLSKNLRSSPPNDGPGLRSPDAVIEQLFQLLESGVIGLPCEWPFPDISQGLKAVKLWDVVTRQELLDLSGAGGALSRARWSADGDAILAGAPWQAWSAPSWEEKTSKKRNSPDRFQEKKAH